MEKLSKEEICDILKQYNVSSDGIESFRSKNKNHYLFKLNSLLNQM